MDVIGGILFAVIHVAGYKRIKGKNWVAVWWSFAWGWVLTSLAAWALSPAGFPVYVIIIFAYFAYQIWRSRRDDDDDDDRGGRRRVEIKLRMPSWRPVWAPAGV